MVIILILKMVVFKKWTIKIKPIINKREIGTLIILIPIAGAVNNTLELPRRIIKRKL